MHNFLLLEVGVDDGTNQFLAASVVAVTPVDCGEVHEDDTCRAVMDVEIVEHCSMGVGGVVAITITTRDVVTEEFRYFGISRTEVQHPHNVKGENWSLMQTF